MTNTYHRKQLEIAHRLKDSTDINIKERAESIFKHYESLDERALKSIFYTDMEYIVEDFCRIIQDFINDLSDKIKYNSKEFVTPSEYFRITCLAYAKQRNFFDYAMFVNYNKIRDCLNAPSIKRNFDFDSEYGEFDKNALTHIILDFFINQNKNLNPILGLELSKHTKYIALMDDLNVEDNQECFIPIDKYNITPPILESLMFFGLRIIDFFNSDIFKITLEKNTLNLKVDMTNIRLMIGLYMYKSPRWVSRPTEDFIRETFKCREIYREMEKCFEQISLFRRS